MELQIFYLFFPNSFSELFLMHQSKKKKKYFQEDISLLNHKRQSYPP